MRPYVILIERSAGRHEAAQIANALAEYCEPTFVCPTPLGKYVDKNVRVIEVDIPSHKYYPSYFSKMARVVARLREEKPDIIYFIDHTPALTLFQPFMKVCPLVQMWHDVKPHPGDNPMLFDLNRLVCTSIVDAIIVHGNSIRNDLLAIHPNLSKKVYVVPHGTNTLFQNYSDPTKNAQEEDNVLLFGRLKAYKGINIFLEAAKIIHEHMPHVIFTIAGEGDLSPYANLLEETKGYVEVDHRTIPDELVPELFLRAKVISLPYIEGSASGVLAVAHAFGKPSVTTAVGSICESLEDGVTDIVVPPGDPKALAESTIKLLQNDSLRQKLKDGIREKVNSELNYDAVAIRLINIYQELINR